MRPAAARQEILRAVERLTAEGLVERTWGNVSARVSDTRFIITPSGLAYAGLRAEQLVPVNIADGSWAGPIKPSSEKGVHAGAYRLRPEVNFVIHTHQTWASIAGIEDRALTGFIHPALGKRVPCAKYGLPGTGQLRRAVAAELGAWPDCRAFLLPRHGALCLGRDMEDAFRSSKALEEICEARVRSVTDGYLTAPAPPDYGFSRRQGDVFLLTLGGAQKIYRIKDRSLPPAASLHAAVYRAGKFRYIAHEASPEVTADSRSGRIHRPYLDDLAQIAGADILCVRPDASHVGAAVRGRNAVLLRGGGALCAGDTESEVDAVRSLLRKGCAARLYARELPNCRPLGLADTALQRMVYLHAYRKKAR